MKSRPVRVSQSATLGPRGSAMRTPMAVDPSLMASSEYSTWKRRPSGEKVLFEMLMEPSSFDAPRFAVPRQTHLIPRSGREYG